MGGTEGLHRQEIKCGSGHTALQDVDGFAGQCTNGWERGCRREMIRPGC